MLSDNYLVKKTKPLIYAQWANMSINELKILEVYLSRIDVQNKNTNVRFTKNEFAELMGYSDGRNLKTKTFDERLSHFLSQQIKIDLEDGTGYHRFNLFSDSKCYYDAGENLAVVDIDCNPKLLPVFVALADGKNDGFQYISYRVEKVKNMKSSYSVKLYNLLLLHAWGNYKWVVSLDELRSLLEATEDSYKTFKFFNYHVLKKAQGEINKLTDIEFEYEKIMKGRLTEKIIFTIKKKKGIIIDMEPNSNEGDENESTMIIENFYQLVNAKAFNNTFSEEETSYFVHLGKKVADTKAAQSAQKGENEEKARIDYYREKYLQMMAGNPKSKKGLLEHLLKVDVAALIGCEYVGKDTTGTGKWKPKTKGGWNNDNLEHDETRVYDWAELEKKLLEID